MASMIFADGYYVVNHIAVIMGKLVDSICIVKANSKVEALKKFNDFAASVEGLNAATFEDVSRANVLE